MRFVATIVSTLLIASAPALGSEHSALYNDLATSSAPVASQSARDDSGRIVFSIPVGPAGASIEGIDGDEVEPNGPQALAVDDNGSFVIADTVGARLLRYSSTGQSIGVVPMSDLVGVTDVAASGDHFIVLDEASDSPTIASFDAAGVEVQRYALPASVRQDGLSGLAAINESRVALEMQGGASYRDLDGSTVVDKSFFATPIEILTPSGPQVAGDRKRRTITRDGLPFATIEVNQVLGGATLLKVFDSGEFFVIVEELADGPEITVDQRILHFAADGSLLAQARVPIAKRLTFVKHGVTVAPDGTVYALVTHRNRVDIVELELARELTPILPDASATSPEATEKVSTCSITRQTVNANAWAYCADNVYYNQNSLTGACSGRTRPRFLSTTPGYRTGVAYDWGGWETVSSYNSYIAGGAPAGDINTAGIEACSKGVDCSGFVTRAWGLTSRYTTSTLPNISYAISSSQLAMGDIINKSGDHVALVDYQAANGLQCWEATLYASYDRTIYFWSPWSRFSGYTPRRYNNICDTTQVTLLNEGAESGAPGWSFQTVRGLSWFVSTTGDTHSGSRVFATGWDSNGYRNNSDVSVVSPSFSLVGRTQATLTFYTKYQAEAGYDYLWVQVSTNGSTWTTVWQASGQSANWPSWAPQMSANLSPYVGNSNVRIRFRLTSDYSYTGWGMDVDDVVVTAQ